MCEIYSCFQLIKRPTQFLIAFRKLDSSCLAISSLMIFISDLIQGALWMMKECSWLKRN